MNWIIRIIKCRKTLWRLKSKGLLGKLLDSGWCWGLKHLENSQKRSHCIDLGDSIVALDRQKRCQPELVQCESHFGKYYSLPPCDCRWRRSELKIPQVWLDIVLSVIVVYLAQSCPVIILEHTHKHLNLVYHLC